VSNHTEVFLSQHIRRPGDRPVRSMPFAHVCDDLTPSCTTSAHRRVACDSHPDYSVRPAPQRPPAFPWFGLQHHHAYVLACIGGERALRTRPGRLLGWEGYGLDQTVWGGEFLRISDTGFERVAHLRPFLLPGGDQAIKEPRRTAIGLLYEMQGDDILTREDLEPVRSFEARDRRLIGRALAHRINAPLTSSGGRLFDAGGGTARACVSVRFEGQAAMELEWAAHGVVTDESYPFRLEAKTGSMVSRLGAAHPISIG